MTLPCSDAQVYSDSRREKKKTNHYLSQISAVLVQIKIYE